LDNKVSDIIDTRCSHEDGGNLILKSWCAVKHNPQRGYVRFLTKAIHAFY